MTRLPSAQAHNAAFLTVNAPKKQRNTPSKQRAREARRLARAASTSQLIEETSGERHEMWSTRQASPNRSVAYERELEGLFDERNIQRKGRVPAFRGKTSAVRPT